LSLLDASNEEGIQANEQKGRDKDESNDPSPKIGIEKGIGAKQFDEDSEARQATP
jgi:hypothetical protein